MKKTIDPLVYWLGAGAVLGTIVSLSWGYISYGESFLQDFVSNWLATFLGVIIGIPVALWVSEVKERETEGERKKKILQLLKEELSHDESYISRLYSTLAEASLDDREISEVSLVLRDDVWKAFADGGELQWIKDPQLLGQLSIAYLQVGAIKKLSERYFELTSMRQQLGRQDIIRGIVFGMQNWAKVFLGLMRDLNKVIQEQLH